MTRRLIPVLLLLLLLGLLTFSVNRYNMLSVYLRWEMEWHKGLRQTNSFFVSVNYIVNTEYASKTLVIDPAVAGMLSK